jgi:hypothetical protein
MTQPRLSPTLTRLSASIALTLCAVLVQTTPASAQSRKRPAAQPAAPSAASAEEASGAPAGYEPAITNALHEFELANYAEARSGFREAHRLYPNARTLRALGMVEFELKNYTEAVEYLRQALDSQERRLSDTQRAGAEQLLARARSYVGRYSVSVRPPNARLLLDGSAPPLDASGALVLPVGDHTLEVEADGHRPLRRQLHVVGGEDESLDVLLIPLPTASSEGPKPDAPASAHTPVYKKWWLWTTIGVVVAGGIATGLVLGLRKSEPGEPSGGNTGTVLRLPPEMMSSGR